jgi:hypothetical protein
MPPVAPSFSPSGLMGPSMAGGAAQVTLNMDAASAFNTTLQAVQQNGGAVQAHQAPTLIRFQTGKRSFWGSALIRMRFDGDVSLSPMGPRQTAVRVALKLNSSSSTMLIAMDAIVLGVLLLGAIMAKNFMLFAFMGAICGVQYWVISSRWANELAQAIGNSLMSAGQTSFAVPAGVPVPNVVRSPEPVPPPIPVSSSPRVPAMAAAAQEPNVLEQLKQLGALRDAGVVTTEEFETKKVELLKRL